MACDWGSVLLKDLISLLRPHELAHLLLGSELAGQLCVCLLRGAQQAQRAEVGAQRLLCRDCGAQQPCLVHQLARDALHRLAASY